KSASLFHLDLQIALLKDGLSLCDSTSCNVQFIGPNPLFIDFLSISPYRQGEMWEGQRQFIEQFLAPLLLMSDYAVPPQAWLRGAGGGIPIGDLAALLPLRRRLSPALLFQVILPAKMQQNLHGQDTRKITARPLSRAGYHG